MKNTFGGFLRNSPPIIMGGVLMFRSARMHRTGARSSASGTSSPMQSWADCITGTHESTFWKRQDLMAEWHSAKAPSFRSASIRGWVLACADFDGPQFESGTLLPFWRRLLPHAL